MTDEKYIIPGFKASAVCAGIKKNEEPDMALILSDGDAVAAGVFTTNQVKAAPVIISSEHIRSGKARAIIINSGNANACNGKKGMDDALMTVEIVAKELGIKPSEVLVASTGVIGALLPMDKVEAAIPELVTSLKDDGIHLAARAIMTTDSFPKIARFKGRIQGKEYQILGIAKGAGMIMPDMATLLCFILTDINIESSALQKALSMSTEPSFNRITVDGDTSTNDTVFVLANGMVDNAVLTEAELNEFQAGLQGVMTDLAKMIVKDGEGATKLVRIEVKGADSKDDALTAARTVANSNLAKTAFYGQDPNWGRIMGALGRSGIRMTEDQVDILINHIKIVENGIGIGPEAEKQAAQQMKEREFNVIIELNQGEFEDYYITSDLTHDYVSINADYRS
jgi:glutamate N-acetyltransferase/amino-acid N-acetyltransferase